MIVAPDSAPTFVANAIAASPAFTTAGLVVFNRDHPEAGSGIFIEEGLDTDLTAAESALVTPTGRGLAIIVGQVTDATPTDQTDGFAVFSTRLEVMIRENVSVNRGPMGTGIKCVAAAFEVIRAVIASATESRVHRRFTSGTFRNLRVANGTWSCVANLTIPTVIK
jgi:hypothetical protein